MLKLDLITLLQKDVKNITTLIEKIQNNDREAIKAFIRRKRQSRNLRSNQDLINQMEAYKTKSSEEITQVHSTIDNCYAAIDTYQLSIDDLNDAITAYEAQITDLETQIANDDLIIAYIPPDSLK